MEEQAAVGRINAGSEATSTGLRLALFEPDRPHNLGMALRLGACLGVPLEQQALLQCPAHHLRVALAGHQLQVGQRGVGEADDGALGVGVPA